MKRILQSTFLTIAIMSGVFASHANACPLCKESTPVDAVDAQALSAGFNDSIYVLLGGLLVVLGGVSTVAVRTIRSSDQKGAK